MTGTASSVQAPPERAPYSAAPATPGKGLVAIYLGITAIVLALLLVFGLLMRASQAGFITIPPNRFYQLLTAHGIGMVAISGLGGAAVMWYFLSRYVSLSRGILLANLVCFLLGVVLVLGAIFVGGFAAAWTFLFPLPAKSLGVWGTGATACYLIGVLLVGVGKAEKFTSAELRKAVGAAFRHLKAKSIKNMAFALDTPYSGAEFVSAAVEGAILGDYEPDRYKTGNIRHARSRVITDRAVGDCHGGGAASGVVRRKRAVIGTVVDESTG